MTLSVIDGAGLDENAIVEEAWAHVVEGISAALTVPGLPEDERLSLRRMLRAAVRIAGQNPIGAA